MRWMRSVSGDIRFVLFYLLASFGHVQNFERTPTDKYVRWMNFTHALVCGLSGSRAVWPVLMRSASCRYPVCILWCPFNLSCERSTTGLVKEFHERVPHANSVRFLYGTYSFCPIYNCNMYVSWPFFVHYLFGTYALITTSVSTFTATETTSITGKTFFAFFCQFRIRYLYLSLNMWQQH